ncbi:MAG: multicopper oxidase domain-containing protein [Acaryochloris sp. RU_4_1]|nr:multicopper oxidase domain-containing protein [Acaryochloris sp. RU_4_1]NJR55359.1 multicopper oxidase domain-containing protein [Acaryochloris sp. CRU_2_0]
MPNFPQWPPAKLWNRRQFIKWGLVGTGTVGAAIALRHLTSQSAQSVKIPPIEAVNASNNSFDPMLLLRDFDYGTIKQEKGRTVREFQVTANSSTLQLNAAVAFVSWNLNNRVPGPTFRVKEGDRVRVIFRNEGGRSHSLHFHGIHPAAMDGVQPIRNGKEAIYEFDAEPYGVHLYHCHVEPVTRHISKGLYGMFIVDPPQARPAADEMVMVMGGYDINNDRQNELYAFNGLPNYYRDRPIPIYQNQLVRLYVLNMIEFDPVVTFHIHANLFQVYRTGRTLTPDEETDVITMGTAERHILEFSYPYPGKYMFHPHQDDIAASGCMGHFQVIPS